MAGRSRQKLKPSIVITCNDAQSRKHNKKVVEGLYWLQPYRLQCLIVLNSQRRILESFSKGLTVSESPGLAISANLSSNTNTLCGLSAAIKRQRPQTDTLFKLGGTILVRGEVFCLTVGHIATPELPIHPAEESSVAELSQGESATDSDSSSSIFSVGESESDSDVDSASDNSDIGDDESESHYIIQDDQVEDIKLKCHHLLISILNVT